MFGYDDDDAQVDGDASGMVNFTPAGAGVPWAREGIPPWHLWGNTITLDPIPLSNEDLRVPQTTGQLIKVSYKRPESWHWVFAARILRAPGGPDAPISSEVVTVSFDVTIGVGRAMVVLNDFEVFQWAWVGSQVVPTAHVMWSTSGLTPALGYTPLNPGPPVPDLATRRVISQLSAQDIQVNCRIDIQSEDGLGDPGAVEVSAFFAPKHHVRPDWFQKMPVVPEVLFAGAETGGK
jgi:hypothetical protein